MNSYQYKLFDKDGVPYCVCGHKQKRTEKGSDEFYRQSILFNRHLDNCHKWYLYCLDQEKKEQLALVEQQKKFDDWEKDQKVFSKKILIGVLMMILGAILIFAIGVSDYHNYAWIGAVLIFGGIYVMAGFSGLLGCVFGGLFDCISQSTSAKDIAKGISMTQTDLEGRNLLFGKDIFGNKLENPFKK